MILQRHGKKINDAVYAQEKGTKCFRICSLLEGEKIDTFQEFRNTSIYKYIAFLIATSNFLAENKHHYDTDNNNISYQQPFEYNRNNIKALYI